MSKTNISVDKVQKGYVDHMNSYYKVEGFKCIASYKDEVITMTWDLEFLSKELGTSSINLEKEINNNETIFPDGYEDEQLQKLLLNKNFKEYEVCYQTTDGRIIRAHKTKIK